ncbi:MAG: prepilin-type N-terminal cleavage/methylation domain-containing protein [Phycisphaerales bacterium]
MSILLKEWRAPSRPKRGFTLIELLVVVAIIALLIGILLPALGEARRQAKLALSMSNIKQMGVATANYASDFKDKMSCFSWQAGKAMPIQSGLTTLITAPAGPGGDVQAAANQAVDILRFRAGRGNGTAAPITQIQGWIPHVLYSHLVVNDYLQQKLPERMVVDPADFARLSWQDDPVNKFEKNFWTPNQVPFAGNDTRRWPYSSSYQMVACGYDRGAPVNGRIVQSAASTSAYQMPTSPAGALLGDKKRSGVSFPAGKIEWMMQEQYHFGKRNRYFADEQARVPNGFFDGSVRVVATRDSNPGGNPNFPTQVNTYMASVYIPKDWEARGPDGSGNYPFDRLYYRWTRSGMKGIDFNGGLNETTGKYEEIVSAGY